MGTDVFISEGGLETTLIFLEGVDLPHFAAFVLLADDEGRARLREYYRSYGELSRGLGLGIVLDTATWRASSDWGARLGYDAAALDVANRQSVQLLREIRAEFQTDTNPILISGCLGPRGTAMTPEPCR